MLLRSLLAATFAATVVPQSVEQLTDKSTHVVEARVLAQQSAREEGPAGIYTRSTLQPLEALKGVVGERLLVRQAGGTVGNAQVELPGDARLQVGERVLIFLHCATERSYCTVVGLAQGVYHLDRGQAVRDFTATSFVGGAPLSAAPEPSAPLAARIRARARETER
jgi:hypothetical protein